MSDLLVGVRCRWGGFGGMRLRFERERETKSRRFASVRRSMSDEARRDSGTSSEEERDQTRAATQRGCGTNLRIHARTAIGATARAVSEPAVARDSSTLGAIRSAGRRDHLARSAPTRNRAKVRSRRFHVRWPKFAWRSSRSKMMTTKMMTVTTWRQRACTVAKLPRDVSKASAAPCRP